MVNSVESVDSDHRSPSNSSDRIVIQGIRAYGYTGYFPAEQTLGQWFSVDLILWLDLAPAGGSDRLEATVDYGSVVQGVQHWLKTETRQTLEALAETLSDRLLHQYPLQRVQVSLTKCHPPIPDFSGQVTIVIQRP